MSSSRKSAVLSTIPPYSLPLIVDETFLPNKLSLSSLTLSPKKNKRATGGLKTRYHQTATVSGQDVILIGGQFAENGNNGTLATSYLAVNPSTMEINEQTAKINTVTSHGAVVYDGKIVIFFGLSSLSPSKFADPVQFLDGYNNVSSPKISGTIPPSRYGHTATLVNEKVYIIGGETADTTGTNKKIITDVSYLDFTANTWTIISIKQAPPALYGHSTVLVNEYLISCFGQDKNQDAQNDCNVFDTTNNSYVMDAKVLGTPPAPRHGATMTTTSDDRNRIIIFGGGDQKNNMTFDDVFVLDASKAPDLQWSPYNITYAGGAKSLAPSGRSGHSTIAMADSKLLMIWGGVSYTSSGTILADANLYFLDTSSNAWIDSSTARSLVSSPSSSITVNSKSKNNSISIILCLIAALVLIIAGFCFFIYRRRRNSQSSPTTNRGIRYDPYIRPSGQLHGSNADLTFDNDEPKKNSSIYANESNRQVMLENVSKGFFEKRQSPSALESQAPFSWNKRPKSTVSVASSQIQMLSDMQAMANAIPLPSTKLHEIHATSDPSKQFPTTPLPAALIESKSQRMKKTHRRTSSVSITAADMHRLSASSNGLISAHSPQRLIQKSKHRPRSSLSNVTYSADYSSKENSAYSPSASHSSSALDPTSIDSQHDFVSPMTQSSTSSQHNNRSSNTSSKSVNSLQWIGFNSTMIDDKEETRSSLHVRNALTVHNSDVLVEEKYSCNNQTCSNKRWEDDMEPPIDGYIVHGEYVDTLPGYDGQRHSVSHCYLEKDGNRNSSDNNHNNNNNNDGGDDNEENPQRSNVPESVSMEDEHGPFVTRQEIHLSKDPFVSNEEKGIVQKARPSSKRQSRVSFALQDEKIEFDGTASSNTLSFARSSRSTETSIQEEEEGPDEEDHEAEFSMQKPKLDLGKPLKLYDEDADESNSMGSRISRFSFSVYDFSIDVPLPQNATSIASEFIAQEVQNSEQKENCPSPSVRSSSLDIRHSIATHLADEGVLWALPDLE